MIFVKHGVFFRLLKFLPYMRVPQTPFFAGRALVRSAKRLARGGPS